MAVMLEGMRRSRLPVVVAALTVAAAVASACGGPSTGTEVRAHTDRQAPDHSMVAPTALANSSLGTDLYRVLATRDGNFVFSPYAVSTGLAMSGAGAAGSTAAQFAVVQHLTPGLDLDAGLNTISQQLAGRGGEQSSTTRRGRVSLDLPVSLWGQKDTHVEQPFLDTLSSAFGTGLRLVDYRSDPEAARRSMNTWVREQTHGSIEELVARGAITDTTRLAVTGAASMQAPWDVPFDPKSSKAAPFTLIDGHTVNPVTMTARAPTGLFYAKSDGWQAVGMPYLGRQLEMIVLAPDAGRFNDVESQFDGAELQRVLTLLKPTPVDLRLPRFGFTTQGDLDEALVQLGAEAAFTPGEADFSGITQDESLSIADFPQQAFISADEDGTVAKATQVIPSNDPTPTVALATVTIDRPFIVMVVDRATNEPVFLGRVMNPAA
jgi:serpin B